ncbi:MerR family transcriptional regulator [Saccharothrix longispora]|uniref:MerR family transcriptional regulator n=1 Tax=Saccharothrix longispora TaxID=33920 RepID=UPI0028FD6ACC|nr:MerR family transcriptional regulator [Saccharothrix longispora]MDU0289088.1 MerR family transcriptional regulator [Saccharothrix longispora]
MRVAELSNRSGVPVPTIKYYLREGLLPAGERTSPNQARYSEEHLHRLRLVRALVEVGGLSISAARDVLGALDDPDKSLYKAMGTVEKAVVALDGEPSSDEVAHEWVREFVTRHGWELEEDSGVYATLVNVLTTARQVGQDTFVDVLDDYARACVDISERDLDWVMTAPSQDAALEMVAVGTVLGDAALAAVRRLARRHAAQRRTAPQPPCP